ncbi:hypothetical protein CNB05585 [Cryptococcus deneoformans JEC21]|uniref:Uncharacterized protein n=1 Tax=Cryptococcus deneoformans (strain JEC21 / ATCC MYA-565) TaxID=214684 RepID=A0A0S2LIW8_CRYD1|nr:hypothetical protein CNB05585 [Cryptococcus neoformans var. neoformans JEC21]ALO60428.1 hypothetical protein CNB05585 [Cryptococcus neoformans var. neoformans JEC21]
MDQLFAYTLIRYFLLTFLSVVCEHPPSVNRAFQHNNHSTTPQRISLRLIESSTQTWKESHIYPSARNGSLRLPSPPTCHRRGWWTCPRPPYGNGNGYGDGYGYGPSRIRDATTCGRGQPSSKASSWWFWTWLWGSWVWWARRTSWRWRGVRETGWEKWGGKETLIEN